MLVNAAAYTNVERAEDEPELAYLVNEHGAGAARARPRASAGLAFVHVSTDFVFDGTKDGAVRRDRRAQPALGLRRVQARRRASPCRREYPDALIVRTAWVFGPGGVELPDQDPRGGARATRRSRSSPTRSARPPTRIDLAARHPRPGRRGRDAGSSTSPAPARARASSWRARCCASRASTSPIEPVTQRRVPHARPRGPLNSVLDCSQGRGSRRDDARVARLRSRASSARSASGARERRAADSRRPVAAGRASCRDRRAQRRRPARPPQSAPLPSRPAPTSVWVMDAESTDGSVERGRTPRRPGVTSSRCPNAGFSASNNRGIEARRARAVRAAAQSGRGARGGRARRRCSRRATRIPTRAASSGRPCSTPTARRRPTRSGASRRWRAPRPALLAPRAAVRGQRQALAQAARTRRRRSTG